MILGGVCADGVVLVADRRPNMARKSRAPIVKLQAFERFAVGGARTREFADEVVFEVGYEMVVGDGSMRSLSITKGLREGDFDEVTGGNSTGFLVGECLEGPTLWHVWPLVRRCSGVEVVGAGHEVESIARLLWNPEWCVTNGIEFGLWLYGLARRHTDHVGDGADVIVVKKDEMSGPEFYRREPPQPARLVSWFAEAARRHLDHQAS